MKKIMLCIATCTALLFASCEPRVEYVEVPVEIDTSNMPEMLKLATAHGLGPWLNHHLQFHDLVIVSYGKGLVYEPSAEFKEQYGDSLPNPTITFVAYDFDEYGRLYLPGLNGNDRPIHIYYTVEGGDEIDPYPAWEGGVHFKSNKDFYLNQYIYDIVYKEEFGY